MASGPVVLVTGALTGIGRACAEAFVQQEARLVLSGRRDEEGKRLVSHLKSLGGTAEYFRADVRQEEDVRNLIEFAIDQFGSIDIAVNSAGTEGKYGPVANLSTDDFACTFETNVLGTMLCLKHELSAMIAQRRGSIVNLSSTMGHRSGPGLAMYCASKHAVDGLTRTAAVEAAEFGVRVNAVAPGPTSTGVFKRLAANHKLRKQAFASVPMKRGAVPSEIANVILFLASDAASFVTGQVLAVDGGKSAL